MLTAVLLSGGFDSAVLLSEEAGRAGRHEVQPIYVSVGLAWERAERAAVARFLEASGLDTELGTLDHNPFPDATPAFRSAMATALSLGLAHALTIEARTRRSPSRRSSGAV